MTFRVRALFVSLIPLATSRGAPTTRYVDVNSTNLDDEAWANLVDWELIGVASLTNNGQFQFDDKEAGRFAQRFYRLRGR